MLRRPIRVAVVDDNDDIRVLIAMHLALDERFELVAQASDGRSAIALLERDDIDAMVLDMHMPEVAGRQVLSAAQRLSPDLRIIAFSADATTLLEASKSGAAAAILKGDTLDGLLAALAPATAVA